MLLHTNSAGDNPAMAHGRANEGNARDWYCKKYGKEVFELSLCVPLWDPRIGGSPDGLVWEPNCPLGPAGMIEIKCPSPDKGMYNSLKELPEEWYVPPEGDYSHIKWEHYDQMQGCMAILNRTWCDYIVYSTGDSTQHVERIPFNPKYWWQELYPSLCRFMDDLQFHKYLLR